jgi:co-chaperonin GroES (HSP10)
MTGAQSIRPAKGMVLVKHDDSMEKERLSAGGILVPEGSYTHENEIMTWGTVIRVGPGRFLKGKKERTPCEVKPGDKVYYNRFLRKSRQGQQMGERLGGGFVLLEEHKDIIAVEEA